MDPGAVMSIIGQTLGEMDYVNKQDLGYIKGNLRDPGQYLANFSQNESVRPYIASAFSEVPRAKGVTNEQYAKLSRDYNFVPEGVNPKTDYGGAPITYRGNIGRVELTGPDGKKYYQYFKKGMY
jgi:hypothetical protein